MSGRDAGERAIVVEEKLLGQRQAAGISKKR
jgi:hypothetical protein